MERVTKEKFLEAILKDALSKIEKDLPNIDEGSIEQLNEVFEFLKSLPDGQQAKFVPDRGKMNPGYFRNVYIYPGEYPDFDKLKEAVNTFNPILKKHTIPEIGVRSPDNGNAYPFTSDITSAKEAVKKKLKELRDKKRHHDKVNSHFSSIGEKLNKNPLSDPKIGLGFLIDELGGREDINRGNIFDLDEKIKDFISFQNLKKHILGERFDGVQEPYRSGIQRNLMNAIGDVSSPIESEFSTDLLRNIQRIGLNSKDPSALYDRILGTENFPESLKGGVEDLRIKALQNKHDKVKNLEEKPAYDWSQENPYMVFGGPNHFHSLVKEIFDAGYKGGKPGFADLEDNLSAYLYDAFGVSALPDDPKVSTILQKARNYASKLLNSKDYWEKKKQRTLTLDELKQEIRTMGSRFNASDTEIDEAIEGAARIGNNPYLIDSYYKALIDLDQVLTVGQLTSQLGQQRPNPNTYMRVAREAASDLYKRVKDDSQTSSNKQKLQDIVDNSSYDQNIDELLKKAVRPPNFDGMDEQTRNYLKLLDEETDAHVRKHVFPFLAGRAMADGTYKSGPFQKSMRENMEDLYRKLYKDKLETIRDYTKTEKDRGLLWAQQYSNVARTLAEKKKEENASKSKAILDIEDMTDSELSRLLRATREMESSGEKSFLLENSYFDEKEKQNKEQWELNRDNALRKFSTIKDAMNNGTPISAPQFMTRQTLPTQTSGKGNMYSSLGGITSNFADWLSSMDKTRREQEMQDLDKAFKIGEIRKNKREKKSQGGGVGVYPELTMPSSSGAEDLFRKRLELLEDQKKNPLMELIKGFNMPPASADLPYWHAVSQGLDNASKAYDAQVAKNTNIQQQALDLEDVYLKSQKEAKQAEFENTIKMYDALAKKEGTAIDLEKNEISRQKLEDDKAYNERYLNILAGQKNAPSKSKAVDAAEYKQVSTDVNALAKIKEHFNLLNELESVVKSEKAFIGPLEGHISPAALKILKYLPGGPNEESVEKTQRAIQLINDNFIKSLHDLSAPGSRLNMFLEKQLSKAKIERTMDPSVILDIIKEKKRDLKKTIEIIHEEYEAYKKGVPLVDAVMSAHNNNNANGPGQDMEGRESLNDNSEEEELLNRWRSRKKGSK